MRRVVIVDDERLARREMRALLAARSDVMVVGEAETLSTAEEVIRASEADAVFLDIQLGRESGLDLCPRLELHVDVVFVTAHDEYAIRAFELNAVDYLLKPVSPERLDMALSRLSSPPEPVRAHDGPLSFDDFLFLRVDGRMRFVRVSSIAAVTAEADFTVLHVMTGEELRLRRTLAEWATRLPATHFTRIHRSAIVNTCAVERIDDDFRSGYAVYLKGWRKPLRMSRRFAAALRERRG